MKFDKIIFFNHGNNGDIHISRNFVKFIMQHSEADVYEYHTRVSTKLLKDIDINHYSDVYDFIHHTQSATDHFIKDNCLYINTWYNANYGKYIADTGVSIHTLFKVFKQAAILAGIDLELLANQPIDNLIPSYAFSKFDNLDIITSFIDKEQRPLILLCTNEVHSGQAVNFDFDPVIDIVSSLNKDKVFIITNIYNNVKIKRDNVIYFEDILPIEENNLVEISYLSQFCNYIVGRASGPYSFSIITENILNPNKTFVVYTTTIAENLKGFGIDFITDKHCKFLHSYHTDSFNVADHLFKVLKND